MNAIKRAAIRRRVVAAVADGASYYGIAKRHSIPISTVWRWVHADLESPPKRDTQLPKEKRSAIAREIVASGDSLREIGRRHGVHHKTVSRIRDRTTFGGVAPRPHRCPNCGGRIVTRVCLVCLTKGVS